MTIQGPQPTSPNIKKKIEQLKAKGYSDLVARRKVVGANIEKQFRKEKGRR